MMQVRRASFGCRISDGAAVDGGFVRSSRVVVGAESHGSDGGIGMLTEEPTGGERSTTSLGHASS